MHCTVDMCESGERHTDVLTRLCFRQNSMAFVLTPEACLQHAGRAAQLRRYRVA